MQERDTIFKNIVRYAGSNLYRQLIGLLTALIRPTLLQPELFGLWSLLNTIPHWGTHLHLGSRTAMRFRLPFHRARGETAEIERVKGSVHHGSFRLFFPATLLIVLAALFWPGLDRTERMGLAVAGVVLLLNWHQDFFISLFKGRENFRLVSQVNYVRTSAVFLFSVALIIPFGIYGAFMGLVAGIVVTTLFMGWRGGLEPVAGYDRALFRDLVRQGFPIMVLNLVSALLRTADKLIIAALLGNRQLGYYAISTMIGGTLMNIPGVSRDVLEPKLMAEAGRSGGGPELLNRHFFKPLTTTAYLMPLLIAPAWLLIDPFVQLLLPHYQPGVPATRIIIIAIYFLSLTYPARGVLVAFDRQRAVVAIGLLALTVNVCLGVFLVRYGQGIEGVAVATGVSFLLLFGLLFTVVVHKERLGWRKLSLILLHVTAPILVTVMALAVVHDIGAGWADFPVLRGGLEMAMITPVLAATMIFGHRSGVVSLPKKA